MRRYCSSLSAATSLSPVVTPRRPEVEALHADVPTDELGGAQLRPRAAGEADRDERPDRPQPPERRREQLAADGVNDDVAAQAVRHLVVDVCLLGADLPA